MGAGCELGNARLYGKGRVGIRAWGFEERLERGEGSRIARLCWREIKNRAIEGGGMSKWEKERVDCYKRWKLGMEEIERKRALSYISITLQYYSHGPVLSFLLFTQLRFFHIN